MLQKHLAGHGVTLEASDLPSHCGPLLAFALSGPVWDEGPENRQRKILIQVNARFTCSDTQEADVMAATVPGLLSARVSSLLEPLHALTPCLPVPVSVPLTHREKGASRFAKSFKAMQYRAPPTALPYSLHLTTHHMLPYDMSCVCGYFKLPPYGFM